MTEKPGAWRKAPPELIDRFAAAVAGVEGLEQRQMFGYPAAFMRGNYGDRPSPGQLDRAPRRRRAIVPRGTGLADLLTDAGQANARIPRPSCSGRRGSGGRTVVGRASGCLRAVAAAKATTQEPMTRP